MSCSSPPSDTNLQLRAGGAVTCTSVQVHLFVVGRGTLVLSVDLISTAELWIDLTADVGVRSPQRLELVRLPDSGEH